MRGAFHELLEEENSGAITSLVASISRNYKSLEEDKRKIFTAELKNRFVTELSER